MEFEAEVVERVVKCCSEGCWVVWFRELPMLSVFSTAAEPELDVTCPFTTVSVCEDVEGAMSISVATRWQEVAAD